MSRAPQGPVTPAAKSSCGNCDCDETASKPAKSLLFEITEFVTRPALSTLGDCLAVVARCEPMPCTVITAASASHWHDIEPGKPDTCYIVIRGATECVDGGDDVTVAIRKGVSVARARAALKGISAQLKRYETLEQFTPKEPPWVPADFDSAPF